ncbi:MAG TPA: hypothetical protein ENK57_04340 [Polyangiaceae bacterium]|nr:hypothetical protein [Polyangiaceae bacterium]
MCRRLEDAHPVAATTFRERVGRRGGEAVSRHDQAARLWLELDEGMRLRLRGAVVVDRGSEERLVGPLGLAQLCSRAHERLESARRFVERAPHPDAAIFRSLRAGDEVMVRAIVAVATAADAPASYRRPGVGFELVPLDQGVIRLFSTVTPRLSSLRPRRSRSSRQLRRLLGLRV